MSDRPLCYYDKATKDFVMRMLAICTDDEVKGIRAAKLVIDTEHYELTVTVYGDKIGAYSLPRDTHKHYALVFKGGRGTKNWKAMKELVEMAFDIPKSSMRLEWTAEPNEAVKLTVQHFCKFKEGFQP